MPKNTGKVTVLQAYLKVLSSEIDLAEIRFIRWVVIKAVLWNRNHMNRNFLISGTGTGTVIG